jgi:hypothetical protein
MTAVAYPYLRPHPDCVVASDWVLVEDGTPVEVAAGCLPHFDYSTRLQVSRRVQVDFDAISASIAHNPMELRLECVTFLGTGGSRLDRRRRILDRQEVRRETQTISIEQAIAGDGLSQSVNLVTELILLSPGEAAGRLSPKSIGARLWRDDYRLSVEPTAPRFPMEVVSFARMFPEGSAGQMWFLDWTPRELDHEFNTAVRLYINEDVAEFVDRIHQADEVTLRLLMTAVAVQMARAALLTVDDDLLKRDYSQSSVGGVIGDWIGQSFPGQTITSVKTLAEFDPARFEMAVASLASGAGNDV